MNIMVIQYSYHAVFEGTSFHVYLQPPLSSTVCFMFGGNIIAGLPSDRRLSVSGVSLKRDRCLHRLAGWQAGGRERAILLASIWQVNGRSEKSYLTFSRKADGARPQRTAGPAKDLPPPPLEYLSFCCRPPPPWQAFVVAGNRTATKQQHRQPTPPSA